MKNQSNFRAIMRDNFWMLMGLVYSQQPSVPAPAVAVEQPVGDDLDYLFSSTGNDVDFTDDDDVYSLSDADNFDDLDNFDTDDFDTSDDSDSDFDDLDYE